MYHPLHMITHFAAFILYKEVMGLSQTLRFVDICPEWTSEMVISVQLTVNVNLCLQKTQEL